MAVYNLKDFSKLVIDGGMQLEVQKGDVNQIEVFSSDESLSFSENEGALHLYAPVPGNPVNREDFVKAVLITKTPLVFVDGTNLSEVLLNSDASSDEIELRFSVGAHLMTNNPESFKEKSVFLNTVFTGAELCLKGFGFICGQVKMGGKVYVSKNAMVTAEASLGGEIIRT